MQDVERHQMKVELEGLIQLLALHLYSEPDVFARELLQNAHDAIVRRRTESLRTGEAAPPESIRIAVDERGRKVSFIDNGAGLSESEIHKFLSTIGRSGTGELKRELRDHNRAAAAELIGQFGIGLLSAFLVASQVDVHTRSTENDGLLWVSHGSAEYTLEPLARDSIGTTVTLHLTSEHTRYLELRRLREIVVRYADLIGIPVFLGSDPSPANRVHGPWKVEHVTEEDRQRAHEHFWSTRADGQAPLFAWPVHVQFTYFDAQQTPRDGEAFGVLGITQDNIPGLASGGSVDVFVSGMFVAGKDRGILPGWASFVQGALECAQLAPNAARDTIMRDDALAALQQALERDILDHLLELSREQPVRFRKLLRWHSFGILGMCIQSRYESAFLELADLIPLRTCDNSLTTIADLRAAEGSRETEIHYISDHDQAAQYHLMGKARGWQVLDASGSFVEAFLRRYERTWPNRVRLVPLDQGAQEEIFRPLSLSQEAHYERLGAAARAAIPKVNIEIDLFSPADSPAVLVDGASGSSRRDLGVMAMDPSLPEYLARAVRGLAEDVENWPTLHLNASCPLTQSLADRSDLFSPRMAAVLKALYHHALLLRAPLLSPEQLLTIGRDLQGLLMQLLDMAPESGAADVR